MITIFELPWQYNELTLAQAKLLQSADAIVLQSGQNAAARDILREHGGCTLDHLFESETDFDELYKKGVGEVMRLSGGGDVLFGIIGDPARNGFVAELRQSATVHLQPGAGKLQSVLYLAADALDVPPGSAYTVLDARELDHAGLDTSLMLVVQGVDSQYIAADTSLALAEWYGDDVQCVVISGNTAEKQLLHELAGMTAFGDGAFIVLPPVPLMQKKRFTYADLVEIMKKLRGMDGCPWDREQTHKSLRQYILEESYEVLDAIDADDMDALYDELGDVLLQVVFHAEIGRQCGEFTHLDVTSAVCGKMINRHPHIFAGGDAKTADAVVTKWEEIKRREKGNKTFVSVLQDVPKTMGAMMRAYKLQKKSRAIGFDWEHTSGALEKIEEELAELRVEIERNDPTRMEEEAGDLLFSIINVLRHMKINPEVALNRTCEKYIERFFYIEQKVGEKIYELSLNELDHLWNEAKRK